MDTATFLANFGHLADAPNGFQKLRELILQLAVRGKLVPQEPDDEPASMLLEKIKVEKERLVKEGKIKKPKPLPPVDPDDMPYELPTGWEWARTGMVCEVVTDGEHNTPPRIPQGVPLVTAKNVRDGVMDLAVTDFVGGDVAAKCWRRCSPQHDDVLMVCVGATTGRTCLLKRPERFVLVRSVALLRPAAVGLLPEYFDQVLRSPTGQEQIWDRVKKSAQPCLYIGRMNLLLIPLPPLAEQKRIVAKVDQLMALCDDLEKKQQERDTVRVGMNHACLNALTAPDSKATRKSWRRIEKHFDLLYDTPDNVKALRQSILQLAVMGRLVPQYPRDEPASVLLEKIQAEKERLVKQGKIKKPKALPPIDLSDVPYVLPAGWEWAAAQDLFTVTGGIQKTPARTPRKNHYPYLRVANVQRGYLDLGRVEEFELYNAELDRFKLRPGDVLVVEGNGSEHEVGRCAAWNGEMEDCVHQNHLIRCRPLLSDLTSFALTFLNSPAGMAEMKHLAITTSGLYNLSVGKIKGIAFPVPPLAEQKRIAAMVDQLMVLCDDQEVKLAQARTDADQLMAAVVNHLVGAAA